MAFFLNSRAISLKSEACVLEMTTQVIRAGVMSMIATFIYKKTVFRSLCI